MKLLKFVLIAVLFVTATSAQGNIPEDIQSFINNVGISANNFVTQVTGGLNAAASDALAAWQTYWGTYSTLQIPFTNVYLVSQQLVQIVNNATANIRAALTDNTAFQTALANAYQNAQNVYQQFLQVYYNATSQGAINCWLTARPQVLFTLETFVNNTARQRLPVVADYRAYIFQENAKLIANFTAYQAALPLSCVVLPWRLAACRDNYVSKHNFFIES